MFRLRSTLQRCLLLYVWPLALTAACGCRPGSALDAMAEDTSSDGSASWVASSSYLATVLSDLLGAAEPVVVLAEPGMCPGHFDLRPSQVRQLRSSRVLARFHFQRSLDARIGLPEGKGPHVVAVTLAGGMCEPASYLEACRQLAEALVDQQRLPASEAEQRVAAVAARMDSLARWCTEEVERAGLRDEPVLCSGHQAAFCRALGLRVIATFSAGDTAPPSEIDQAIKAGEEAGIRLLVANRPEGRQMADALADRLGARVVMFGNFPERNGAGAFDELVRRNVALLIESTRP